MTLAAVVPLVLMGPERERIPLVRPRSGARRRRLPWVAALVILLGASLLVPGCGRAKKKAGGGYPVGLVFDVGGLGDKSFNDAAYTGLVRARDQLGIQFEYVEPTEASDRQTALRQFAMNPDSLILGIGFLFSDDIKAVAREFPKKLFGCIDYTWSEGDSVPPNLLGIKFREEEGAYLVGAIAGLVTKTGIVGMVGGMDIPLIHKFEAGYRAGFAATRPDGKVLVNYAGVTGEAFKNPAKGKELALSQIDGGADIIFHASGSTGLGVFEAVRERKKLGIGVDADQEDVAPGFVLTSMIKKVDVAVYDAIDQARQGRFRSGILSLGLKEGGLDYVYNQRNQRWITPEIHGQVEALRRQIISGQIQVPSR